MCLGQKVPAQVLQEWAQIVVITWQEASRMTNDDLTRVVKLLCTLESKFRFRAFTIDLSKICTGQLTPDALLAYEF